MITSPNAKYVYKEDVEERYSLGNNNFKRRFKWAFETILTTDYFEGSNYGKYFNELREDGSEKSKIYVDQYDLENRLKTEFVDGDEDKTKFLVGALGVGKTTLLRNFFKVFGREIVEKDGNLIIYVSLYSMVSSNKGTNEEKLTNALATAIGLAVKHLSGMDSVRRIQSYDTKFYDSLFNFIEYHSSYLIEDYRQAPIEKNISESNYSKAVLSALYKDNYLEYQLCLLKYYLIEIRKENPIKNVMLIIDDLESLSLKHTSHIIDETYAIRKCLEAVNSKNEKTGIKRKYNVKVLVALRHYSLRNINRERLNTVYRVTGKDVIVKNSVPSLKEVLSCRVDYLMHKPEIINQYSNKEKFQQAVDTLYDILDALYHKYDNMLLSLTHNNIFISMQLLLRIVTNKKFVGIYEKNTQGAFELKPEVYMDTYNGTRMLKNDDAFFALVYGENEIYVDTGDYYLTNILHYKLEDEANTQLMGIFIIQFMIQKGIVAFIKEKDKENKEKSDSKSLTGIGKTVKGKDIVEVIVGLFDLVEVKAQGLRTGLEFMIKKLYEGGALLQSIVDPSYEDATVFERVYHNDMRVFLSSRGLELYEMLSRNALLLEVYRDDIDTDLDGNAVPTLEMTQTERIAYCLNYVEELYYSEHALFRRIKNKKIYIETLGSTFPTVVLLKGIKSSIEAYYKKPTSEKTVLYSLYNSVAGKVHNMIMEMNECGIYCFDDVSLL